MFSIGIRYLNGWAMAAADGARKEQAEWPPHPDRAFMALVAAWFETGQCDAEGEALRWLESLPSPPDIAASAAETRRAASAAETRRVVTSYVPVNDTTLAGEKKINELRDKADVKLGELKEAGLEILAEFRSRQGRSFPVAIPHDPVVHLIWRDDLPDCHREALISLCCKVTSVGHSASLVQMWVEDSPPEPMWVPVQGPAKLRMRVAGAGRLAYLEARCNRDAVVRYRDLIGRREELKEQGKKLETARKQAVKHLKGAGKTSAEAPYKEGISVLDAELQDIATQLSAFNGREPMSFRPDPGRWQGYDAPCQEPEAATRGSVFDPRLIVLKLSGKRLSLPATLKLTEALRGALLKACPQPIPEWVSGHAADGTRSDKPHIALLPLPFVGAEHADGRLMGVALALPRDLDPAEAVRVLEPWLRREEDWLPRTIKLFDGQWLECAAELDASESPPWNLRPETLTASARCWASVTPVVIDRHFDGADKWEKAAESVKDACVRVGLPRPNEVLLHPVSMFEGVPRSNEFPWMTRKKDGGRMHHAHAVIIFGEEVQGPVLVGAGRFRGYGLCRPLPQGGNGNA